MVYVYQGDPAIGEHFSYVPARDLSDQEVEDLGEALAAVVKSSKLYVHQPTTGKAADQREADFLAAAKAADLAAKAQAKADAKAADSAPEAAKTEAAPTA
jgi:hypothetical protein